MTRCELCDDAPSEVSAQSMELCAECANAVSRHRGECVCGWRGRWLVNPNDADYARLQHVERVISSQESKRFRVGRFASHEAHRTVVVDKTGYRYY